MDLIYGLLGGLATTVSAAGWWHSTTKARGAANEATRIQQENDELLKQKEATAAETKRVHGLQSEATRLATENAALNTRLAELGKQSANLKVSLSTAEKTASDAKTALDRAQAAAERAQTAAERARTAEAQTRAELEAALEAATTPQAAALTPEQSVQNEAALAALEADRDAARNALERAQSEAVALRDAHTETELLLETVRAEAQTAQAELVRVQAEFSQAQAEAQTSNDARATEAALRDAERKQQEDEQDARFNRLQEFAEKQVAKLQQENRELRAGLEAQKTGEGSAVSVPAANSELASPQYLRSVIATAAEGIVLLDGRGHIVTWNPAAEKLFGYAEVEATGKPLSGLLVPDDRGTLTRALAETGQDAGTTGGTTPLKLEMLAVRRGGGTFPVEASLSAWRAGGEVHYAAGIVDVTEKRRAEDLRRAKEAADEANRAKSQFLANMSHELRTPLNAIIGFSEILHDRTFGELTGKQDRYVGNILTSGRHLLQLINDILDLSKVEAGHVELEYVAFPVGVAIRSIDSLVKALLTKKNITLDVEVPQELPVLIADQGKFKQVLYNLVSNAIKFTPEGGKVTISAETEETGQTLRVSVKDTGIGIKKEDQERIFKEFEQIDSSYARTQQGTGLGLALARRFVLMHGGRIQVESEGEGKGTTFSFTMPFVPSEDDPNDTESGTESNGAKADGVVLSAGNGGAPTVGKDTNKPIILVVDDDQGASELLTHHLGLAGYTVSRAFNGADAVLLARELNPAVITLDVQLPDCEGYDVLAELKKDAATRDIPVLMVSIIEDRDRATALGAADVFVKPVLKDKLLQAIAREVSARDARALGIGTAGPAPAGLDADASAAGGEAEPVTVAASVPATNGTGARNGKKSNGRGGRG